MLKRLEIDDLAPTCLRGPHFCMFLIRQLQVDFFVLLSRDCHGDALRLRLRVLLLDLAYEALLAWSVRLLLQGFLQLLELLVYPLFFRLHFCGGLTGLLVALFERTGQVALVICVVVVLDLDFERRWLWLFHR